MAIRQQFVVEAGRFKDSKVAVRSPPRAVQVVENAETLAKKNGLAPWIANVSLHLDLLFLEYIYIFFLTQSPFRPYDNQSGYMDYHFEQLYWSVAFL